MSNRSLCLALCLMLLALQAFWQFGPSPELAAASFLGKSLLLLPIALICALFIASKRSAGFWAGVVALFYFCHGVMEVWSIPATRWLSAAELTIAVAIVLAASWPGLQARFGAKSGSDV